MKIDVRDSVSSFVLVAETEIQGSEYGRITERGCLLRTHPLIKISRTTLNIQGRQLGSSGEVSSWNGSASQPRRCYGSMENVRSPFCPLMPSKTLIF